LDQLYTGELQTLPTDYLVRLVKLLIALCKQSNSQIQSDISLIAQLDRDCFDFIAAHEQLEALRNYNAVLLSEAEIYKADQKSHFEMIYELQENISSILSDRIKDCRDITELMKDKIDLESKLKDNKSKLESKENELTKVKNEYSGKNGKLKTKVESLEKENKKKKQKTVLEREKEKSKKLKGDLAIAKDELEQEKANNGVPLDLTNMSYLEEQKDLMQAEVETLKKEKAKQEEIIDKKNEEISKLKNERESMSKDKKAIWTDLEKELT